ncbi:PREDICTED: E3 ubiquitin-protein ligase TRIM11-like, partial [Hipposideros armiger]|uniref:RING-type E3 ubiquitin transferase n=1 Tax=Hipposideros armiger TaxID=186990 RepID=A0A8B7QR48_HIPAR
MDFPAQLNIAEELTCPMCLQLLTEPLSLDCGHSFCQACITANNESVSAPGGECHCPVCQSRYQPWNLRPNLQLANIVKKLREVNTTSQQWQGADLCEQHGENRLIFCKEDGKAICKLCVLSVEHHGHQMFPIEEVAQECQEKLQEALKRLTEEEQEAEKLEADISDERATWKAGRDYIDLLVLGASEVGTGRSRGAAAMASGVLLNILEELTCPICLELLTKPLSLDCGHSFCQACITANKESVNSQEGESSCPVCRATYQPGDLRSNWFVDNIVERLREVKVSPEEEQKIDLCVRHGEKLQLFCKEDGKVICWLCERSQEHRGHHTSLVEEVAQEYQEKLQAALERLRKEQKKAEAFNSDIRAEGASWK